MKDLCCIFEVVYSLLEHGGDGLGDLSSPAWGQVSPSPSQPRVLKIKAVKLSWQTRVCSRLRGSLFKIL